MPRELSRISRLLEFLDHADVFAGRSPVRLFFVSSFYAAAVFTTETVLFLG